MSRRGPAAWSGCLGGTQTRACTDANACGVTTGQPTESQSCSMTPGAIVTNLDTRFRAGQVFLTFREMAGIGVIYQVYRSVQPITSVSGLTPVATLPQGSGINQHTQTALIITDLGSPLPAGTGLLVLTSRQTGSFYYAVTNSTTSALVAGVNATTTSVNETVWATPGAVQQRLPYTNYEGNRLTEYFAWEDYAA